MAVAADITHFSCPDCSVQLEPAHTSPEICVSCGWKGQALLFRPVLPQIEEAAVALADDATCVHHPVKQAVAVCAGTGDYICSLCAIEIKGQTYSAQHLNAVGANKLGKAFDRHLARPDRTVVLFLILCFVPYVNFFWIIGMPVWVVLGYRKLFASSRLRKQDPLFARLVSRARLKLIGVLLALFFVAFLAGIVAVIVAVMVE